MGEGVSPGGLVFEAYEDAERKDFAALVFQGQFAAFHLEAAFAGKAEGLADEGFAEHGGVAVGVEGEDHEAVFGARICETVRSMPKSSSSSFHFSPSGPWP